MWGTYQGNGLTGYSSESFCPQSPHLTKPLWTDLCLKSRISVLKLISTLKKKKKKKEQAGKDSLNLPPETMHASKSQTTATKTHFSFLRFDQFETTDFDFGPY